MTTDDLKKRPRPICEHCTRNARTVDTPRVHVRVDSCTVLRPSPISAPNVYDVICRCHGLITTIRVEWEPPVSELDIENLSAFQKAK